MKQRMQILILLAVICTLCSGCIIEPRQLERLGLATAVGLDKEKGGKVKGVVVLHHFGASPEDIAQQLTSVAYTGNGLFRFMNLETSDRLVSGQLRIAIYGKELAKEDGIARLAEGLKRDASTQTNMYLAISETTAKDILYQEKEEEHKKNMGTYLYNMIRQNIEGDELISCTLQEFVRDYYRVGKDAVLPLLEKRRDFVLIDGAALMHAGKFVKGITGAEAFYVKALRDGFKGGGQTDLKLELAPLKKFYQGQGDAPKHFYVNLQQIALERKVKLIKQKDPVFDIDVKVKASIAAMTEEMSLGQSGVYDAFGTAVSKEIKKQLEKTVKELLEYGVDPVGFGNIYDSSIRNLRLTDKDWYETLYPKAKFQIDVKTKIIRSGVLN